MLIQDERCYTFTLAANIIDDGMNLELWETTTQPESQILSAFYSDVKGEITITAFRENLPLAILEAFIVEAKRRLPPIQQIGT